MHKIIKFLRAYTKGTDDSAPVHRLLIIRDAALVHEIDYAVAEHLGVDPQVFVISQE